MCLGCDTPAITITSAWDLTVFKGVVTRNSTSVTPLVSLPVPTLVSSPTWDVSFTIPPSSRTHLRASDFPSSMCTFLINCHQPGALPHKQQPATQASLLVFPSIQGGPEKWNIKKAWRLKSYLLAKCKSTTRLQLIKGYDSLAAYKERRTEVKMAGLAPKALDGSSYLGQDNATLNRLTLSSKAGHIGDRASETMGHS